MWDDEQLLDLCLGAAAAYQDPPLLLCPQG